MAKKIHIATYQRVIFNGVSVAEHLKKDLPDFGTSVVVRLGGTMPYLDYNIQINSAQAVKNSIDKKKQKELLIGAGLKTLPLLKAPVYPCVVKGIIRSGGINVFIARDADQFRKIEQQINGGYVIEPLFDATSEYRLHCTKDEVFFAVKKQKRNPDDIIINRDNHYNVREFQLPRLWKQMREECLKAMRVLDLDLACFDVMYSSKNPDKHDFAIAEANTNPELLHNTYMKYLETIKKLVYKKIEEQKKDVAIHAEKPKARGKAKLTDEQKLLLYSRVVADEYSFDDDGNIVITL